MTQQLSGMCRGRRALIQLGVLAVCVAVASGAPQPQPQPQPQTAGGRGEEGGGGGGGGRGLCGEPSPVMQPAAPDEAMAAFGQAQGDPAITCTAAASPNHVHILHEAERNFSMDFLTYLARNNGGANIFVSPYSVYEALLLAYYTAAGHTEDSLKKMLHLPDSMAKIDVLTAHACSQHVLNAQRASQLRSVNRIYLDKKLQPTDCVRKVLYNEIEPISFDGTNATAIINEWVAQQTSGKIPQLLLPNSLSTRTKLVLTNAAYFKDLWLSQFLPEKTKKEVFYLDSHPIEEKLTMMMRQKGSFKVQRLDMLAHVLELPYKNTNVAMIVLLPPMARNANDTQGRNAGVLEGVDGVLSRFTAADLTRILESDVTPKQVEVALPKFSASQSIDLVQTLEAMGVGDVFRPTANLTDLTGSPGITFDSVAHQAKIDVDEAGTEAAGATAIFSFRSSRPLQPETFICDHPFVYLIVDKTSKTVLFAGIYRNPTS